MARHEQDREDLLREATALVLRVELLLADVNQSTVIGFRRDGSGSLFVGSDPVFQFNKNNELRRGYWNGKLIKAKKGRLVELTRVRTATEVQLRRRELGAEETNTFLQLLRDSIQQILSAITHHKCTIVGQVPPNADVLSAAADWLIALTDDIRIADVPNVG